MVTSSDGRINELVQPIRLIEIRQHSTLGEEGWNLPEVALKACASTASHYEKAGFAPPWIGYLAVAGTEVVGTCAFTAVPVSGRVEIAYYTLPAFEGRGIATSMAKEMMLIARTNDSATELFARTLPVPNASNAILQKLGFVLAGLVEDPEEGLVWEWRKTEL
jgi:ribosomal-protein-alanine N-acetyltransferase